MICNVQEVAEIRNESIFWLRSRVAGLHILIPDATHAPSTRKITRVACDQYTCAANGLRVKEKSMIKHVSNYSITRAGPVHDSYSAI